MINKDKVIEIAKESGFSIKDEMIVLDEHSDYTATLALYAFAEALEAHIVGDGEPIGRYFSDQIHFTILGLEKDKVKSGDLLYTKSPSYLAKEAECDRYREALVAITNDWSEAECIAGDVTRENGRIKLSRAIHIFRWESIGFDGMIANPKSNKVTLKPLSNNVDIPATSEIFSIPVNENWGL